MDIAVASIQPRGITTSLVNEPPGHLAFAFVYCPDVRLSGRPRATPGLVVFFCAPRAIRRLLLELAARGPGRNRGPPLRTTVGQTFARAHARTLQTHRDIHPIYIAGACSYFVALRRAVVYKRRGLLPGRHLVTARAIGALAGESLLQPAAFSLV